MKVALTDEDRSEPENEGAALWRRTLEELLAKGANRAEAVEGANLILEAHKRQRAAKVSDIEAPSGGDNTKISGIRCRPPRPPK